MKKYILVWKIHDHADNGGGIDSERFEEKKEMDRKVNELAVEYGEIFSVQIAGELSAEYLYKPKSIVTSYEAVELRS